MATERQQLLHITHARQDEAWVQGVLLPALGLTEGQYWTRAEDDLGAPKLEEMERAVQACRYTLLVASSAARVDQWAQFAGQLAERLGIEEGKPRLLLVARDFVPGSERARELLPLRQRCLVCLDCSAPERTTAALASLAAQLALTTTEAPPAECPYPGLRMFGAGDPASCFNRPDLFFGRDDEGRAIVEQLRGGGRVLLVGPSGCGKSSLVRARVLPALGQGADAMAIAVARPGAHPCVALRAALDALDPRLGPAIDAYLGAKDSPAARAALIAATAGPRRLVYLDQLEEVFLDEADERGERARFFAQLAALGRVPGVAILLGMRADFYGDLMRSPAWDDFKDHRVELAPLRGAALRLAITRPAEVAGVYVEADLVERLVREADLDRAAEALPLLQVALEQLWAQREWRYLSLASYARIADGERRGLDVVLARHADASIVALAAPVQVLARRVLIDLVSLGEGRPDTRRRRSASELRRAGDDNRALAQVLDHLSARRLIAISAEASEVAAVQMVALQAANGAHDDTCTDDETSADDINAADPDDADRHVDLAHDTLITGWPALAGWIRARRDDLRTQRRLEARAAGGGLLAASELPEFTRWVAWIATPTGQTLGATDTLRKLVRRSVAARRFRRGAFGIGLVAATAFAIVFGLQTLQLREEKTKTQRSISKAAETAKLIVFEIDTKLKTLAGASSVRETLLKRSHELLADLRKLGKLSEDEQRTDLVGREAQGDFALERGRLEEASALYLETLKDALRRAAVDPTNSTWQRDLSISYNKWGDVAVTAGKLADARAWFEKALAVDKSLVATAPANAEWQRGVLIAYTKLGDIAVTTGKHDEARAWFEKALAVDKSLVAIAPANADWQHGLFTAYVRLGDVAVTVGKLHDARAWFDKSLAVAKALVAANPVNATWQCDLWSSYDRLGGVAVTAGKLDDARAWFEKALAIGKPLAAAETAVTTWQRNLAVSYGRLGDVAATAGKLDDARAWFEKALAVGKSLAAADPTNATWQRDLAGAYDRLGDVTVTASKLDDARAWFEKALTIRQILATANTANTEWQRNLAVSYSKLGDLAATAGKLDDARAWFENALAVGKSLAAADPANATWQHDLAGAYGRLGNVAVTASKLDDARAWSEKALSIYQFLAADDPASTEWQRNLAVSYIRLGDVAVTADKLDDARTWFEKALAIDKTLTAVDPSNTVWQRDLALSYVRLGGVDMTADKIDEARAWFEKALAVDKALISAAPTNTAWQRDLAGAYAKLGGVDVLAGKIDDARAWFEKSLAVGKSLAVADPTNAGQQREICISLAAIVQVARDANEARQYLDEARIIYDRLQQSGFFQGDTQFAQLGDVLNMLAFAVRIGALPKS